MRRDRTEATGVRADPVRYRVRVTGCPLCGSQATPVKWTVVTDAAYAVRVCRGCGLAYTTPRPTPEHLAAFYGAAYFRRAESGTSFGYSDYEGESWAGINATRAWSELESWVPEVRGIPHRRLIDIGAATGEFAAAAAADGWEAVACEVGDEARATAAAKGLASVRSVEEATGSFGLITMFHVLEHMIDPLAALVSARRVVHPQGVLVIELPSWHSAGRIVRGRRWAQLRPPEHINFFTPRTLRRAASLAGWTPVRHSTPYPRAGDLASSALRAGQLRAAASYAAQHALGSMGMGGYLRLVAIPRAGSPISAAGEDARRGG